MADVMRGGKTISECFQHLLDAGYSPDALVPELRTNDDWKSARFWFRTYNGVYVGVVDHTFTSMEEVGEQVKAARAISPPDGRGTG